MNVTDMTDDDATQLPLFASLPPLATLCFGVSCLLFSLLLILLTVRHHTKRYLLPVSSLQSALSSNRVTHCNAEIKSCSAHDPFLNLSFATTHLRRKVHTYGFIKSTYREFYLFNKRATNVEKSLMATKEGNGDSRVRVHWTVGWKEGAGEGQDVVGETRRGRHAETQRQYQFGGGLRGQVTEVQECQEDWQTLPVARRRRGAAAPAAEPAQRQEAQDTQEDR